MGVGSVAGALAAGARGRVGPRLLVGAAAAFGVAELLAAAAPTLPLQIAALVPLGAVSVTFAAGVNSSLQLAVEPAMRGRVMALYSVVFLGSTPIGAPLVGWLAEVAGPRAGLVLGAAAALAAAAGAHVAFARARPATPAARRVRARHPHGRGQLGPARASEHALDRRHVGVAAPVPDLHVGLAAERAVRRVGAAPTAARRSAGTSASIQACVSTSAESASSSPLGGAHR